MVKRVGSFTENNGNYEHHSLGIARQMKLSKILLVMGFIFLFLNLIIAVIPVTDVWESTSGSLIIIVIVAGFAVAFMILAQVIRIVVFKK